MPCPVCRSAISSSEVLPVIGELVQACQEELDAAERKRKKEEEKARKKAKYRGTGGSGQEKSGPALCTSISIHECDLDQGLVAHFADVQAHNQAVYERQLRCGGLINAVLEENSEGSCNAHSDAPFADHEMDTTFPVGAYAGPERSRANTDGLASGADVSIRTGSREGAALVVSKTTYTEVAAVASKPAAKQAWESTTRSVLKPQSCNVAATPYFDLQMAESWPCPACTFLNPSSRRACEMCNSSCPGESGPIPCRENSGGNYGVGSRGIPAGKRGKVGGRGGRRRCRGGSGGFGGRGGKNGVTGERRAPGPRGGAEAKAWEGNHKQSKQNFGGGATTMSMTTAHTLA